MEFKDSKTYVNLQNALNKELTASTRYQIYGDKARQEGFVEYGNIFDRAALDDKAHARIWLEKLNGGTVPSTLENITYAIEQENITGNDLYRQYSQTAREEGFNDIAALFNGIANIELNHELQLETMRDDINNNQVFCKSEAVLWICLVCGNIMSGECAPEICPVCGFPQGYYKVFIPSNL